MKYIIETRGRTLEETAALFDGEQPALELQQLGHEAATFTLNELQSMTLRSRLDARLHGAGEDITLQASDKSEKSSVKLAVDLLPSTPSSTESSPPNSRRPSHQIERPPSFVSVHSIP